MGRQVEMAFRTHGGKRAGAGRKPTGKRAGVSHAKRAPIDGRCPVQITIKAVAEVGRLRKRHAYRAVRRAMATSVGWSKTSGRFRICQLSIHGNHLHLLAEADDRAALSRGMQGFASSCAKELNAEVGKRSGLDGPRRGLVFADRYHEVVLDSPTRVRNALRYVLCNWRKHGEDVGCDLRLDPFSSAVSLFPWTRGHPLPMTDETALLPVWFPRTWLLSVGWQQAGAISPWDRPGAPGPR